MLISHSHRFIFIHVGKTGGMSMRKTLGPFCEEPERFKMRRPPKEIDGKPNRMRGVWETLLLHAKAKDGQKELPREVFEGYFKFAFVRNPWDLQVSMYHFVLREPTAPRHNAVKACGTFDRFVEWVAATPDPYPRGITKLQRDMLTDKDGNLLVDFVGRYESLNEDFARVCRRLGLTLDLPHLNRSSHSDYRSYYNERTKAIVDECFRADIELFGYAFDGAKSAAAV